MEKKFDLVDFVINFENGNLSEGQVVKGFQYLINIGIAWVLQGSYGRFARDLIESGYCVEKNK